MLTIQADCEIGGSHIYVDDWTLRAPTVDDQWRVARIASEEIDHCRKMLRLLNFIDVDRSDILELVLTHPVDEETEGRESAQVGMSSLNASTSRLLRGRSRRWSVPSYH